jgi:hypothetical protein
MLPQHAFVQRLHPFLEGLGRARSWLATNLVGLRRVAKEVFLLVRLCIIIVFNGGCEGIIRPKSISNRP